MSAERTAAAVHTTVCALVTTQAATSSAWSEYASILLDPETAAFFAARLSSDAQAAEHPPSKKKKKKRKRKPNADDSFSDEQSEDGPVVAVCEHCGGAVPEISLRVASLDGTTLVVTVAQRGLVCEVKRLLGQARDMAPGVIELFVDGKEDGLPDSGRLDQLGLGSGSVVFMLHHRDEWRWDECGSDITLSEEGLVATKDKNSDTCLVTGGSPMIEGRHYWEVEWAGGGQNGGACFIAAGAVRPGLDHDKALTNDAYFIFGADGALHGNGKAGDDRQGGFAKGDRIGVLLDLDAGWMRFYRSGKRCGPGYTEGVTGPLVRAAQLYWAGNKVTALPAAVAPEGAGDADEPWEEPPPESGSGAAADC
jgi:hypothetical protein